MNVYDSIIYTKLNDNEAQLGGYSDEDQNALYQIECPQSLTIKQYVDIDSKQYTVTRVAKSSFRGCTSLTTVNFPDTISVIEDFAFDQTKINDLKLPKDLTSIGLWSFGTNYIETIEFPENLQYIADCAFSPAKKNFKCLMFQKITNIYHLIHKGHYTIKIKQFYILFQSS